MRYYLINEDLEVAIDVLVSKGLRERERKVICKYKGVDKNILIRKLAGEYFASFDGLSWRQVAKQEGPQKILNINNVYSLYRGYKPSGLVVGAEGEFVTQMPGKIIKIAVKIGEKIKAGDILIVIEAMKMENEIRSPKDGIVEKIHITEGQVLDEGVIMMEVNLV